MSQEEIFCMECSSNIILPKEEEKKSYLTPLTIDERSSKINDIIETRNFEDIKTAVCINCSHECLIKMKERLEEEDKKNDDCLQALKDLLLDISNKKEINKIIDNLLNEQEIKDLEKQYKELKTKRKKFEEKIKRDKEDFKKLKDDEQNIYINLNEINREKEDKRLYAEKLKKKKKYLEDLYNQMIKNK